jgi:hypothetical protein
MIGAAIRYAEIVSTTTGMMIGTCNKHGIGFLYMTNATLVYTIKVSVVSSQTGACISKCIFGLRK